MRLFNAALARPVAFLLTTLIPTLAAVIVVFLVLDVKYESRSVFQPPASQSSSGALQSMLGEGGAALADMMGVGIGSNAEADVIMTILNSRELHQAVIDRFKLREHYETSPKKFPADVLKEFRSNLGIEQNEENMFVVVVKDVDYKLAADINRFMIAWTDSAYNVIKGNQARMTGNFYHARLESVSHTLDSLSSNFVAFQKKNHFFQPDVQLEAGMKIMGDMDAERSAVELDLETEQAIHGKQSSRSNQLRERLGIISSQIEQKNKGNLGIGLPSGLDKFAELSRQYFDMDRELRVQNSLYKYLRQKVEELELAEARNLKNLVVLDSPWENAKKASPPRMAITLVVLLVSIVLAFMVCALLEFVRNESATGTPFASEWKQAGKRIRTLLGK